MSEKALNVLGVVGSLKTNSVTRVAIRDALERLRGAGCHTDLLDLKEVALPMYNPDSAREGKAYLALKPRVDRADVLLLGTPDYHGSISSPMKNFLDHFWHEFAGKLFASIVASHEKGLTVTDQLRTVARQCYAWSMPYGVSFVEKVDVNETTVLSDGFRAKLRMLARDVRVYGSLLARQRHEDLACTDECFMSKHRPK